MDAYDAEANLIEAIARELLAGREDAYPVARTVTSRIRELIDARIQATTGAAT